MATWVNAMLLISACCVGMNSAAVTRRPLQTNNIAGHGSQHQKQPATVVNTDVDRYYHPAEVSKPKLVEQYDQRSLDGHYEYRYLLSNGDTRYERAYWLPVGKTNVLARKGYYSYPLPNHKYLTVFYTADQNGYRQDSASYSKTQPILPRSLEVPAYAPPHTAPLHTPVKVPAMVAATKKPATITHRPTSLHITTTTKSPLHQHNNHWPTLQYQW